MKKRLFSLCLALALALPMVPAVRAAGAVTPTPPEWCPEEEYAVFPGSAAYEPENWAILEACRKEVKWGAINVAALPDRRAFYALPDELEDGSKDIGVLFEQSLVEVRLNYSHDDYNGPYWTSLWSVRGGNVVDGNSELLEGLTDQQRYAILLWTARGTLRYKGVGEELCAYIPALMEFPQFSLGKLTDTPIFTPEEQAQLAPQVAALWAEYTSPANITVYVDDIAVEMDVPPDAREGRTMVPIRAVAEALGADISWDQATSTVTMTRAATTVTMTLGSATATIDGRPVEMDVAPYATDGRTLIPARYVAEFFGQKVDWDGEKRQVLITEDKSVAGDSNLEAWAVNMGLIRGFIDFGANYGLSEPYGRPIHFGQFERSAEEVETVRSALASAWSATGRENVIALIQRMTPHGHNDSFQEAAELANSLTEEEMSYLISISSETDQYMWPYTKEISERWGDKGILAWDLSRMANIAQWGYTAGYLTYEEALKLIEPAAQMAAETFTSWDEFYLNYLDGYNWWARNDVYTYREQYIEAAKEVYANDAYGREVPEDIEDWVILPRSKYYQYAIQKTDDALFQTGVIGLPEE